jgi:hypothetical protein
MSANMEYGGLCTTCKQASDCTFAGHAGKPVLFCEEFDTGEPSAAKDRGPRHTVPPRIHAGEDENSARSLGLCRNCENRVTCAFPRPDGGVWHCEEYQ